MSFSPTSFSPASGGLIDFLREGMEAALSTSPKIPNSPTNNSPPGKNALTSSRPRQLPTMERPEAGRSAAPTTSPASMLDTSKAQENAALISELEDDVEALRSKLAALTDQLTAIESGSPEINSLSTSPPHTGWTPSKVVVLGDDADGNLVELPSTIEPGGFRYSGTPSFWIAIS